MNDVLLCVAIVLALLYLTGPSILGGQADFKDLSIGYATPAPATSAHTPAPKDNESKTNYNDYLQSVALDPSIGQQHKDWTDNLMLNYQPRMYSVRDDVSEENKRVGLLRTDYSNAINENQNISLPSSRIAVESDGGNSRFGGFGMGLCKGNKPVY